MASVSMTINGKQVSGEVEGRTLLVEFLREHQRLTGTHVGCDTTQCGACTIHMNGEAVKSCTMLAAQADGAEVSTIEGLANGDELMVWDGKTLSAVDIDSGEIIVTADLNGAAGVRADKFIDGNLYVISPNGALAKFSLR